MPNNEDALKEHAFKPGESGNPNGRPKGVKNTATVINEFLEALSKHRNPITGEYENLTVKQRMILAQIGQALAGNTKAFNAVLDRTDGKPVQQVELGGPGGVPLAPTQIIVEGIAGTEKPTE